MLLYMFFQVVSVAFDIVDDGAWDVGIETVQIVNFFFHEVGVVFVGDEGTEDLELDCYGGDVVNKVFCDNVLNLGSDDW